MIQNALQTVVTTALSAYIRRPDLELYVITGNDVTQSPLSVLYFVST